MKCHQCVCLLLQVSAFVANCLAKNLILNINFKKPIAVTDRAFLSFTLDPTTLQRNDLIKNIERSTNLARSLAPAYIRLGGPHSNFYNFEQAYSHEIDTDPNDMYFGTQWTVIYQWAKNAGLDVIVCITPQYIDNESKTDSKDPRNIAELLSFSDRMGYNISWQLGYECQTRCDLFGGQLGQYVAYLRKILKTFPRYSNSLIIGPDIVAYKTPQQQRYLQNYLHSANSALSAITWHPNLDSVSLNDNISIHYNYDNIIAEKDEMYKVISRAAKDKPLWIAESKPEESKCQYLGALIWTRRLGNAAKLGIQVVMRQLSDLSQATPEYWVSLLYKTLVGREVLETKFQSEDHVHFYSQCTKPSALYSKGAITIFGINLTKKNVIASLKNLKIKIFHKYILSPDFETGNKMFSENVLLNNKSLHLINDKELPDINPEIIINPDGLELELSSGDIGFWVIPNAKVTACICSEEEGIENNTVKKLSKRHENDVRQDNQEEKEDESSVIEDDVRENINQSNLKNQKIYEKQDRKKQKNVENTKTKSQENVWNFKLLAQIRKIVQKQLQKKNKKEPSNLQKSFMIDLGEEQEKSFEEIEKQQKLDKKDFKKTEVNDKFENIRDILKKYKCILLEKKAEMKTEGIQDLESEIQNIDNAVTLISKIDAFLLNKVTSNESIISEIKNKTKNEEESIGRMSKKLTEYLTEIENSTETKSNIIKRIEKYFNKFYNLLENKDNSAKNSKNSQIFVHEDLMKGKRFKRHLDKKSENSKKIRILKKRSQIDSLKDYMFKQKIKWKNDDGKKLISSDNSKKNFDNNENKYNNLLQRDPINRFFKNIAFENAAHQIDYQHLVQEHKRKENDSIYRKRSKIGNIEKYQSLVQEPERTKRDINKKLVEIGVRRDNTSRKRLKIDDLKNYANERKTKQKDDIKREGLLVPFNPRITDSDENNFYGFFRRDPIKGFPEGDIFVTTGDSLEKKENDYDYVEDEGNGNDDLEKENMQNNQKSMLSHTEDTWVEKVEDDNSNYMPNEFFENIKLTNTRIKENSKNYDDLWEAEFLSEEHKNNKNTNNNNNNKITAAEVIQKASNEKKEKETNVQHTQLLNYYDDSEKQEYDRDALRPASRYSSMPFDQLSETPTSNINYQASNVKLKEAKLEPETKLSFYVPSQASTARYNSGNYQTSNINHDNIKLEDEKGFVMKIDSRDDINAKKTQYSRPTSVYAEHPIHDKICHNERNKRSNWEALRKVFAEEMIKEDEENARDCHCRVIRASDSPKKFYYRRVKRNILPTTRFTDTSSENISTNTNVAQSKKNVQTPMTREKYDKIMAGEILPSTSIIEPVSEEFSTTTESVITDSSTLDHKLSDTTQAIDVTSISEVDNIPEQYRKKSTTNLLPIDSASEMSLNNNNSVKYVTKETFFRSQPSDVQSKNKTKAYDSSQVISKIPLENEGNREERIVSVTKNAQETTCEKVQDFINEKEKADNSIYPTTTENQKNEEGHNNNYKTGLNSTNFFKETSKGIAGQVTTETILSKRAANTANDNSKSNKSKTNSKLLQNIHDKQNSESKAQMGKVHVNTKRLKITLKNPPLASLEGFTRTEERLMRRTEQIDRLKKKLHARREKLLHQYQNELTEIADEQKRNLKRREAWEKLRESDDFRRLINHQKAFVGVLLNDDVTYEDDDKNYLISIELVPKQYNNNIDQMSSLDRRDVNRAVSNKKTGELNNIDKNLKVDNLDSTFAINKKTEDFGTETSIRNKEFANSDNRKKDIMHSKTTEDAEEVIKTKKSENVELIKHEEINQSYNSNDKAEHNLNIKMSNNNIADDYVKKNIDNDLKARELGKENMRTRRDIEKLIGEYMGQNLQFRLIKAENVRDELNRMRIFLKEESLKEIFNDRSSPIILVIKRDIPLSADLFRRSKNDLVSSKRDFKVNQENEKERESNYITFIPIKIKNIYEMLDAKNDDLLDISERWDDLDVLRKIPNSMNEYLEYLDDEASEKFEYEDLSNLQNENIENIPDKETSYKNEQDVSVEDSEAESEKDKQYEIISDKIDKYLKLKSEIGSNERGLFLLLPWRNMEKHEKRLKRQIKNKINKDIVEIKREVTRHSQSNKPILAKDLKNKRTKRYLNNNIDQEEEENIIETIQPQTNRKNRDDLLEDFIKAHKKNNLYNNEASSLKNEDKDIIIPLNNISKGNKKLLQEAKLRNHMESVEKFVDDSEEKFNDILTPDEDKHHKNGTSGTTGNAFYTAIMNIKDFFQFSQKFLKYLGLNFK
ncbi:uncharacterized protein LOC143899781 isoform X1 [Temnothorax americanus]|uniref:uncharacterized protein LOC143899781 isoform X1 n=1 Tax=Temnothorax americanus TaxID=1964332 RepID=UPI0040686F02